jgi:hypothetical protein
MFYSQLERWSRNEPADKRQRQQEEDGNHSDEQPQPQPYQYSLQLLVPPGQLELGRRLITAMYSSSPDLSDLEAPQLMALVALAECYGVGKVVTAAAAQLHRLNIDTMPLETAAAVFELPEACLGLPAFMPVQQTAASKLQQQLGDLEVVWGDEDKQQALLALPLGALLQLLKDDRTAVASEDTAVYTAAAWLAAHEGAAVSASQLLGVLRLPWCTATYLSATRVRNDLTSWGLSLPEVCDLGAMAGLPDSGRRSWARSVYPRRTAWHLARRPASAVAQLEVDAQLSLSELQVMYGEATAADAGGRLATRSPTGTHVWQGRAWQVGLYVRMKDAPQVGMFMCCPTVGACCDAQLRLLATAEAGREMVSCKTARYVTVMDKSSVYASSSWAELRAWLEARHLVHPGGLLHFTCTVTKVL